MSPIRSVYSFLFLYSAIEVDTSVSHFGGCPSHPVDVTSKGETRDTDSKTRIQVGVDKGLCMKDIDSDGDTCLALHGWMLHNKSILKVLTSSLCAFLLVLVAASTCESASDSKESQPSPHGRSSLSSPSPSSPILGSK